MTITINSVRVHNNSMEVNVTWKENSPVVINETRQYNFPFRAGMTVAMAKSLLKDKLVEFRAERDTNTRFKAFEGNTYDESQL